MKILFLAFDLPYPLDRGGRVKSFHFLSALARHHEVTLVALSRSPREREYLKYFDRLHAVHLIPIQLSTTRKILMAGGTLGQKKPFIMALYDVREMRDKVAELLREQKYNVIYADHLHASQYIPQPANAFTVLDEHNVETMFMRRFFETLPPGPVKAFAWWEWKRMAAYEAAECRHFDMVLATTSHDADLVRSWGRPGQQVRVIPIGVDVEYFKPTPRPPRSRTLVNLGTLSWPPNADGVLWFCREVLPLVRAQVPDVALQVIGDGPPPAIRKLSQEGTLQLLGRVDDVRPYLANCAGLIVPLRMGSGMRVKILDALASGTPVVTTSIGCECIAVTHRQSALIADGPQAFAQATVELLNDTELQQRLSSAGRTVVMERYAWPIVYDQIEKILVGIPV